MDFNDFFIWVEGPQDKIFVESILKPIFQQRHASVKIIYHAGRGPKRCENLIKSLKSMNSDYLFFADFDANHTCVTDKKDEIVKKIPNIDRNKIVIVKFEIESWYAAGLDKSKCGKLRFKHVPNTEKLTKEMFDEEKHRQYFSKIAFMKEILKVFSISTAKNQNSSFAYLFKKHINWKYHSSNA